MSAVLSPPATASAFDIKVFDAPLGAEVTALDLSQPLSNGDFQRLHRAHLDHHVLVFREQRITPQQQVEFSRRFGPLQIHVLRNFQLAEQPEVLIISNIIEDGQPTGLGDAGHFWHSDLSYKEVPSLGSMLHAQELPEEGGDTLFANMHWLTTRCRWRCGAPCKACAPSIATWRSMRSCAAAIPIARR